MTDRDQVAREALTEFADECEAQGRLGMADEARAYRDLTYPAPAAPVTVTVRHDGKDIAWERQDGERKWRSYDGWWFPVSCREGDFLSRIAADAQRIAELEKSLAHQTDMASQADVACSIAARERDEARRALDLQLEYSIQLQLLIEWLDRGGMNGDDALVMRHLCEHHAQKADRIALRLQAATSQGEGLGAPASTSDEAPKSEVTGGGIAAASPAPIPLGADGKPFDQTMDATLWAEEFVRLFPAHDKGLMLAWFANAIMRGYDTARAKYEHPVATRETVERVAEALFQDRKRVVSITLDWSNLRNDLRETHRIAARAALRALGYTIQEGT